MGHMKKQRQGFWSTKPRNAQADQLKYDNMYTNITPYTHRKQKYVYCKIWYMKETIYTDLTGKFPVKSSRVNRYIMVIMEIDTNYINTKPIKNRT